MKYLCLWAALVLGATPYAEGMRKYRSKEAILKSNAPAKVAKAVGKRVDYYCKLFEQFYDGLGLKKKNDNVLKLRLFATYDEYEEYYQRSETGLGGTPLAYFSPSLNSIVMYSDERDVALRAVVFHECSHQFLNRYTYDAPKWINEGLAEYFEGWKVDSGVSFETRPHLYDLVLVQRALKAGTYLDPRTLVEMKWQTFNKFGENFPNLHGYLHYATSWSLVYHCLESGDESDRKRIEDYLLALTREGPNAKFEVDDWSAFEQRWKASTLALDPSPTDALGQFLIASGYRANAEWEKAIGGFQATIALDPAMPSVGYWLGFCQKKTGDYAAATKTLRGVCEDDPTDPRAPYYLARIYLGIDKRSATPQPKEALVYAEMANKIAKGENPLYLWILARAQIEAGDPKRGVRTAKSILRAVDSEERERWEPLVNELRELAR